VPLVGGANSTSIWAGTFARHRLPATPGGTARGPQGMAMTNPGP
jgi:hypothetical protein